VVTVTPRTTVLTNVGSARCADVDGSQWTDGRKAQSWVCNTTDAQRWAYTAANQLKGPSANLCLSPTATPASGAILQVRACGGAQASYQVWQFRSDKSIYNPTSGLCLNDAGNAVNLTMATCSGANSQKWNYT
jgi:hypothetical protein